MKEARGVALIIVIFAMLLFAVLGWTLANLQTGDFEANLRNLDSEQALSLAEAGAQWTLNQLSQNSGWRTDAASPDSDCNDANDWELYTLSPGQYRVCCRNPVSGTENGNAIIESSGYMLQYANYRAMRTVKLIVELGGLNKAIQTQTAGVGNQGLFNWWPARQNHAVLIEGDISSGYYDGDGDASYNETNQDYGLSPLLPPGNPGDERNSNINFPSIDMLDFYNNASNRWPNPSNRPITATATIGGVGSWIQVSSNGFFTAADEDEVVIRKNDVADWWIGDAGDNWTVITDVPGAQQGRRANVSPSVGWTGSNVPIKLVKRFYQNLYNNQGIWYIGSGQDSDDENLRAETLIDLTLNNNDVKLRNTYLISEGDIVVKATNASGQLQDNELLIRFTGSGPRYPALATKKSDIISIEPLETLALSEDDRMALRRASGLIYSELGIVNLNYLGYPTTGSTSLRGNLVYGNQITLDGQIAIRYLPDVISTDGFAFTPSVLSWQEQ